MLEEGLKGVTNENTRLALTHSYTGDISLAQKHLLKAAHEDDDDLAKFLIVYSVESGGGFGFEEGGLDYKMLLNQLVERKYAPAIIYYDMWPASSIEQLEEETEMPCLLKAMYAVKFNLNSLFGVYLNWLARFGDARSQIVTAVKCINTKEAHQWYKKAAQQNHISGISHMTEYYYTKKA